VSVDGRIAVLGERAAVDADIRLDGARLELAGGAQLAREVLIYHKPSGELSTRADP
jgi:23S rRNA pseudouridine2605 synthase